MAVKSNQTSSLLDGFVCWNVEPDFIVQEPRGQIYRIKMQFSRENREPVELHFDLDTLSKANELVKVLRNYNVKWGALFKSYTYFLPKNTIRLHFDSAYVGTMMRENHVCEVLGMGEVFKMFAPGTGFQSDDFAIVKVNEDPNAVDLVFSSDLPENERIKKWKTRGSKSYRHSMKNENLFESI